MKKMTNNIYLETNSGLIEYLNSNYTSDTLFIIDSNLSDINIDEKVNARVSYFEIKEDTKNLASVEKIWDLLFEQNLNRSSEIVIIGGGVLLDVCAFASSTFKRGISFSFVPSTLLSMVDASHGGKNGFNNTYGKNQIGTFTLPERVIICYELLDTLHIDNYKDGLIELIKHGMIANEKIFNSMITQAGFNVDFETIKQGINVKMNIVNEDFLEGNKRKLLNFGHTVGHIIEKDSNYEVTHGQAVAMGIYYELLISKEQLGLPKDIINSYLNYLNKIEYNYKYNFLSNSKKLIEILKHDKKSSKENVDIVLLYEIGNPKVINLTFNELIEVIQN
tara:strand:- start:53540 stop:54541 length:1002 start_codon:yes stop_codon:yes gene_type:complete